MKHGLVIFSLTILLTACGGDSQANISVSNSSKSEVKTFAQFSAAMYPIRNAGNPIITSAVSWHNGNACDYSVILNPLNPKQLLMFFSGYTIDDVAAGKIGRATASIDNPYSWVEDPEPVMTPSASGWDDYSVRLTNVWSEGTTIYMSYEGFSLETNAYEIGIATSTDAGRTWTKYSGNPVIYPIGSETHTSQGYVYKEGNTYYMYYSSRSYGAPCYYPVAITGIMVATASSPFGPYTRIGGYIHSGFAESHQVLKMDDGTYVLFYESPNDGCGKPGSTWTLNMATASSATATFVEWKGNPYLKASGVPGTFDYAHVATGKWTYINSQWMLFYAGGENLADFNYSHWQGGIATLPPLH